MADLDDVSDAITDRIVTLASDMESKSAEYSLQYAAAINQLAEARAWLVSVSQAHGGTTITTR